ncbi:MAG TPA: cysteine synthase family protein [Rhizomicrobium sp.]|nr:cysteine synthase family protein [Rhizomicrobium sp.]
MTAAPAKPLGMTLLERIGNTPLLRLESLTAHLQGVQVLGKAEWANPGGSVKDRAASAIVGDAQKKGLLTAGNASSGMPRASSEMPRALSEMPRAVSGMPRALSGMPRALLDATSGNTGIAYAMLGAAQGFAVTLCMPSNVSPERRRILDAYGATIVWTDPSEGSDGAIRMARKLASEQPDRYFYADQYGNDNNWRAHYYGTANEIWEQTEGRVTHFVAGLGTSGTFMGTTRRLRELNPTIQCISMQPDSPFNGLEGLKHMATAIVPPIYDANLADRNIDMPTERAYAMAKRLGRTQGLLVGVSAAAAVAASLQVAEEEARAGREAVIVTILCDSADKYLTERFWSEPSENESSGDAAAADAVDSATYEGQRA